MRKRLDSVSPRLVLWGLLLAVSIVAASAASFPDAEPEAAPRATQEAQPVVVTFTPLPQVNRVGAYHMRVRPPRAEVRPGGDVRFVIAGGGEGTIWQVIFKDDSPAQGGAMEFAGTGATFTITISDTAELDVYAYTIAFTIGDRIYLRDPEIEVVFP
jgi:hypothetical protein